MPDENGPQGPRGPGGNQPPNTNVDPTMSAALDQMNTTLASIEGFMRKTAEQSGAVVENVDDANKKLHEFFRMSKNIEDSHKAIVSFAKKRAQQTKGELMESGKARKELQALAQMYKDALASAKAQSKETQAWVKNLKKAEEILKELPEIGQATEQQFRKVAEVFDAAATDAKAIAKAMESVGRSGAALKGMTGILGAMGIGKSVNQKMNRRLEQVEEIKDKIRESKEIRSAAIMKHMGQKREKGIAEIKAKAKSGAWGYGGDIGDDGELTESGHARLARKLGFKPGSDTFDKFMKGEAAGGPGAAAGSEAAQGWTAAMGEGGGAIDMLAEVIEGGVGKLMEFGPAIAIGLEAAVGVIGILIEVFDTYAKQNQEMEKKIGAGGLFTQPGMGAGTAFSNARFQLNPTPGMGAISLGQTFERNLAIAGAMAQTGYSPAASLNPNAANTANNAAGAIPTEFMRGGLGEVQRIVMGAGRVGGLTDQEGVEQVMKLLVQYRETMASSEQFMTQLNKDTAAAGVSTTKYLKIIDDVSAHFDKMGKSLDQVTGVMRELSRYGAISSESLHDMMEFLSAGQQQTTTGNMATAAFTQSIMPKDLLDSLREAQKSTLSNYVDEYNAEAKRQGMKPMSVGDIQNAIGKGDFAGAQGMANAMRGDINKLTDPTVKQTMTDALTKVQDQINKVSGVMSPDFLKRASSQGLYGENQADVMAALLGNLRKSADLSGLSMSDLMAGNGSASQQIMVQQLAEMLGVKGSPAKAFNILRNVGQNRVSDLTGAGETMDMRRRDAKVLFGEIYKGAKTKDGIAAYLTSKGIGKELFEGAQTGDEVLDKVASSDEGIAALQKLFGQNLDLIAGSATTQDKLVSATKDGNKTGDTALAEQIAQARGIARRTQTVEDFLNDILKPLLNDLISAVEYIAKAIGKLPWFTGGKYDNAVKEQQSDMAAIPDAIKTLNDEIDANHEDLKAFTKSHADKTGKLSKDDVDEANKRSAQIQIATDTLAKLKEVQQRGSFGAGQEPLVMEAIKKIQAGQNPQLTGAGFGAVTVNNYYDANYTQDTAQPASAATAKGEHPADTKGTAMSKKANSTQ